MANQYWDIPEEWKGETAFVVAGGPSFKSINPECLRGQHVIAINSSFHAVPFADYLIFADSRWWEHNWQNLATFRGRILSLSQSSRHNQLLRLRRVTRPSGEGRDVLFVQFTTATAAIELAAKLGAARIILLGLDGKAAPDGKMHHHRPHPWPNVAGWEGKHRRDLMALIEPLKHLAICHGTPGSTYEFWPTMELTGLIPQRVAA